MKNLIPEKPDPDPEPEKPDPDPEPEKPDPDPEPEIPQEWAGKVVWTHGLTGMPDPQMWEYAYLTPSKVRGLKWNKAYGWFDCNKKDVWGEQPNSDNNLCWAASVSNIIYWWLEQNKEYVNRFGYDGPSAIMVRWIVRCLIFTKKISRILVIMWLLH